MTHRLFHIRSDPNLAASRNSAMIDGIASLEESSATAQPISYARPQVARFIQPKRRHSQMTTTQERTAWVAEMDRIKTLRDQAAFADLFDYFAPRLKGFLMRGGTSEALAEEIAQEVMAIVWTKADMFDASRASVSTWIFTIARNRKIDVLRKTQRPEPEDLSWGPQAEPDQADQLSAQQEQSQLKTAMSQLPQKQRELVERAYFGDQSHSQIASETGLPLGTIKSRIRLALDRLRHAMDGN